MPCNRFWPANKQTNSHTDRRAGNPKSKAATTNLELGPVEGHMAKGAARRVPEIESTTNINRLVTGYYARLHVRAGWSI